MQKTISYDIDELNALSRGKSIHKNAHNAYGALIEKNAVCDGFSAAFQFVVQTMGYRCTKVTGTSDYRSFGEVDHAWNIIEFDGNYYHIDLTWDSNQYCENREFSYDWFMLDDESILADHNWNAEPMDVYLSQLFMDMALQTKSQVEINYSWSEKTGCFLCKLL